MDHPRAKPLGAARVKGLVVVLSVLVLGLGRMLAPARQPAALTPPKEHAAPILAPEQRQTPLRTWASLPELSGRVARYAVALSGVSAPPPAVPQLDFQGLVRPAPDTPTAVMIADGEVLTHAAALGGRAAVGVQMADGTSDAATVVAFDPETGLALLRLASARTEAAPIAADPSAGTIGVAVGGTGEHLVVAPVFVTTRTTRTFAFTPHTAEVPAGAPLFTVDGECFGIAAGPASPGIGYAIAGALASLRQAVREGRGNPPSLGIVLQPLSDPLTGVFGERGVLVSDVLGNAAAIAAAPIRPGDVLTSVRTAEIDSIEAARTAIAALGDEKTVEVTLLRNRTPTTATVPVQTAFALWGAGRRNEDAEDHPTLAAVLDDPRTVIDGTPSDARVLAVNGRPVSTADEARRALRGPAPVTVLYVQHGGRRSFIARAQRR